MAGQKRAMKKVAIVQAVNPRQCPSHGAAKGIGEPTYCTNCDRPVRGIGHACWKQGDEIHDPDPELLRGALPPLVASLKSLKHWLVELPEQKPMQCWARNRPALRKSLKKLLQLEKLPAGTRIVELTS